MTEQTEPVEASKQRPRMESLGLKVREHSNFRETPHVRFDDIRRAIGDMYEAFTMFVNNSEECRDGVFPDEVERVLGLIKMGDEQ
jgi:hypothetical protein